MDSRNKQDVNNAGVQCIRAGRLDEARDLFRAALNLSSANHYPELFPPPHVPPPREQARCVTPDCAMVEQHQVHQMETESPHVSQQPFITQGGSALQPRPAIFLNGDESSRMDDVTIVFNLALVHHLEDAKSWKARVFYEMAAAIVAIQGENPDHPFLFQNIMYNLGVLCHQNQDNGNARTYFAATMIAVLCNPASQGLPEGFRAHLLSNLQRGNVVE